jgi:hypothetical protein
MVELDQLFLFLPSRTNQENVISTEAAHSLTVSGAVEKSASPLELSQATRPPSAVLPALAIIFSRFPPKNRMSSPKTT